MKTFVTRGLIALIFASLFFGVVAPAESDAPNPGRAQEMRRIEDQFYVFWKLSLSPAPDYQAIRQALDRMGESVGKIRTSYPDAALEKPLKDLSFKVDRLKKAAAGKDRSALQKGYDDLHQSCFQCHFTHDQPRP